MRIGFIRRVCDDRALQRDIAHVQCRGDIKSAVLIRRFEGVDALAGGARTIQLGQEEGTCLFECEPLTSGVDIVVVSAVAAIGTGVYFLYKQISKKRKSKEVAFQSIKLENVGTCKNCSEPLIGSEYVDENTSDSHTAYIICKKCGEKNYAWYTDGDDVQELSE